jgi:hypothetical protein
VQKLDDRRILDLGADGIVFFLGGILDLDVVKVKVPGAE